MTHDDFFAALAERKKWVYDFLHDERYAAQFSPDHIRDAVYGYLRAGGKSLRPAVLLFSCGAVGGDEKAAIPVAAAVEISHTWTLVHDDIIDRDALRRGVPTVHEAFRRRAEDELGYGANEAAHYGLSIAILAGDMQQGWAVSMLTELADRSPVDPRLALYLIREIEMG
ncbi:MAG: polyprenyl synthetase family protein, partial [Candidatus Poribacteria bacterium]|nr:polyprenyl synthetase family protein [Candidatus Poribacteria bacterium]